MPFDVWGTGGILLKTNTSTPTNPRPFHKLRPRCGMPGRSLFSKSCACWALRLYGCVLAAFFGKLPSLSGILSWTLSSTIILNTAHTSKVDAFFHRLRPSVTFQSFDLVPVRLTPQ
ncbi:hypothetical protein BJX70DRAFT_358929 [Aspergillus crustosus]